MVTERYSPTDEHTDRKKIRLHGEFFCAISNPIFYITNNNKLAYSGPDKILGRSKGFVYRSSLKNLRFYRLFQGR